MNIFLLLGILVILLVLGFFKLLYPLFELKKRRNFSGLFLDNFREFCTSIQTETINNELYEWLKLNTDRQQRKMGGYGIAETYRPAATQHIFHNYQIITSTIGNLKDIWTRARSLRIFDGLVNDEISNLENSMLTYMGSLDNKIFQVKSLFKNPLLSLREGVRLVLRSPIYLLYWSGLIEKNKYESFGNSLIFKIISYIIVLIGLISSVITIVNGYKDFIASIIPGL